MSDLLSLPPVAALQLLSTRLFDGRRCRPSTERSTLLFGLALPPLLRLRFGAFRVVDGSWPEVVRGAWKECVIEEYCLRW